MDHWEKEISKTMQADPLTEAGLRKRKRLNQLNENLIETKKEYDALKADILNDAKYNSMDPELQRACDEYYFNGKKDTDLDFPGENFIRTVRNYCHRLE